MSTRFGASQKQPKASGWHFLIVKDDSAAIAVGLLSSSSAIKMLICLPPDQTLLCSEAVSTEAWPTPHVLDYVRHRQF